MSVIEDQLITQYLPLVRRLAAQTALRVPANVELEDLVQAGLTGLLGCIRRYKRRSDAEFETYAITRIRGAILDELRAQDWFPRGVRNRSRRIEEVVSRLQHRLGRAATDQEIATELDVTQEDYFELLEASQDVQIIHFDDLTRHRPEAGSSAPEVNVNAALPGSEPFQALVSSKMRKALIEAIENLPEQDQALLQLQVVEGMTQREAAAVMGLTEGRISQIRTLTVIRLRASLAEQGWLS